MKVIMQIRPGEGGEDAKLLVADQARIYLKFAERTGIKANLIDEGHGWIDLAFEGKEVQLLLAEAGGHRWQRVPPTERKGRVHTSTVTITVMRVLPEQDYTLRDSDIEIFITRDQVLVDNIETQLIHVSLCGTNLLV